MADINVVPRGETALWVSIHLDGAEFGCVVDRLSIHLSRDLPHEARVLIHDHRLDHPPGREAPALLPAQKLFAVIEYQSFYAVRHLPTGAEVPMGDGVDALFQEGDEELEALTPGTEGFVQEWEESLNANPQETLEAYFPELVGQEEESSHTTLPWHVAPTGDGSLPICDAAGRRIAEAYPRDMPESVTNAVLMAAAPELLEVAQWYEDALARRVGEDWPSHLSAAEEERLVRVRALLLRATVPNLPSWPPRPNDAPLWMDAVNTPTAWRSACKTFLACPPAERGSPVLEQLFRAVVQQAEQQRPQEEES